MNSYSKEVYKLEQVYAYTKQLRVILHEKYEKSDLNKVMKNLCRHLKEIQCNELIKSLQKTKDFFDGTLGTWKKDPVEFKLK